MSTLHLLVILLLAVVAVLVFGALVYLTHQHPAWREPLVVGFTGLGLLAAVVTLIVTRR
ncbi:hypothetical protein [Streptomyces chrestomyceticus]|uniref:hypothetical protein n=1 Tax=Streptomyces chrestomyceticus TaxID=68185 RepID=UPI0033C46EEF